MKFAPDFLVLYSNLRSEIISCVLCVEIEMSNFLLHWAVHYILSVRSVLRAFVWFCVCVWERGTCPRGSYQVGVSASITLIYYSNCASSTLLHHGIAVTSVSNSSLNCRRWDNQWRVNRETLGAISAARRQEMNRFIWLSSYDQAYYSVTFMHISDTKIAITAISHACRGASFVSPAWCRHAPIY